MLRDSTILALIVVASVSAAALVIGDALRDDDAQSREFQTLLRGLGLGSQGSLAHGIALFDPRLQPEQPGAPQSGASQGDCVWHPLTIFPAPISTRHTDRSDQ